MQVDDVVNVLPKIVITLNVTLKALRVFVKLKVFMIITYSLSVNAADITNIAHVQVNTAFLVPQLCEGINNYSQ